jgi:hypothetical protein
MRLTDLLLRTSPARRPGWATAEAAHEAAPSFLVA